MCTLSSQWCYDFRKSVETTCGWKRTQDLEACPLLYATLEWKARELFLTETEILKLYKIFVQHTHMSDETFSSNEGVYYPAERVMIDDAIWKGDRVRGTRFLRIQQFLVMPWFRKNAFAPRIFDVFRDEADGMTFDAFTLMMSTLKSTASLAVKTKLAFALFDFNNDGMIEPGDLRVLLEVSTGVRNLWADAQMKEEFHKPGPNVTQGWKMFPKLQTVARPMTEIEEGDLRVMCFEMSKIIFDAATPAGTAIVEHDFTKVLSEIPDAARFYSIELNL